MSLESPDWLLPKPEPLACYQCLLPYEGDHWVEAVVPNDVWRRISPTGDEGGILCVNCIASRLQQLGLSYVPTLITAGPLSTDHRARWLLTAIEDAGHDGSRASDCDMCRIVQNVQAELRNESSEID